MRKDVSSQLLGAVLVLVTWVCLLVWVIHHPDGRLAHWLLPIVGRVD